MMPMHAEVTVAAFHLIAERPNGFHVERTDDVHDRELARLARHHGDAANLVVLRRDEDVDVFALLVIAHLRQRAPAFAVELRAHLVEVSLRIRTVFGELVVLHVDLLHALEQVLDRFGVRIVAALHGPAADRDGDRPDGQVHRLGGLAMQVSERRHLDLLRAGTGTQAQQGCGHGKAMEHDGLPVLFAAHLLRNTDSLRSEGAMSTQEADEGRRNHARATAP